MTFPHLGPWSALAAALVSSACAMHGGRGGMMASPSADSAGMCAMHRQMTAGKSPADQRAAVEAHVKSMHGSVAPGMVDHHLKMMDMHCPAGAAAPAKQ